MGLCQRIHHNSCCFNFGFPSNSSSPIVSAATNAGGLLGWANSICVYINNCGVYAGSISSGTSAGGVFGTQCIPSISLFSVFVHSSVSVIGNTSAGGFGGCTSVTYGVFVDISNSYTDASVKSNNYCGGFVGKGPFNANYSYVFSQKVSGANSSTTGVFIGSTSLPVSLNECLFYTSPLSLLGNGGY